MAFDKKYLKWIFLGVAAIIILAIILYFVFRNPVEDPNKTNTPVPPNSPTPKWVKESFPLNVGMYGPKIKAMQAVLGNITVDGKLGPQTKGAIESAGYSLPLSEPDYNKIFGGTVIGKTAYASSDGVSVYDVNFKIYKTAAKDEWIGKISGTNGNWYEVASGTYQVSKDLVYTK